MEQEEKVRSSLSEKFAEDLWIHRRLKLSEVIRHLESIEHWNEGVELKDSIRDWIRFFEFLDGECSGRNFSTDKQWSELLNLMQISRKLNHRSVKVKDIIKNREIIESNAKSIKRLNESAKLGQTIESSLNDLDSLLQMCVLDMLPPKSGTIASSGEQIGFMLDELSVARGYIHDRCWPMLNTLKMELDDELMANNSRLADWRAKIGKHGVLLDKITNFIDTLYSLQSKLMHLRPLMSVDNNNKHDKRQSSLSLTAVNEQVVDSIAACKRKFKIVQEFHIKLIESLYSLVPVRGDKKSASTTKNSSSRITLPLVKLINNKNEFAQDIYGEGLIKALKDLDKCRHALDTIMLTLRLEFGRFYFVNDLELLTIIALDSRLVTDGKSVLNQRLLCKLFNNSISGFVVQDNQLVGIKSPSNETITLSEEPIAIKKKVNMYSVEIVRILNETIRKLRRCLKSMLMRSLNCTHLADTIDWSLPVQLMNLAEYVKFGKRVEKVLMDNNSNEQSSMNGLIEFYESRFKELSRPVASSNRPDWIREFKNSAAISLTVNFISTLMELKLHNVVRLDDWHWQKHSRYYVTPHPDEQLEVRIADTQFQYKFDYLPLEANDFGAGGQSSSKPTFKRLISTQITGRCFLVASQSVCNFRLGANPYGPAGSGKTETIKALGHSLGCQVIVHNCDESNDSESLDKLIWGLAHTGLWGCFDEFNRLSASVLSTVSSTLELVQTSIRENKTTVELADGTLMCIDRDSAFFVTLNPGDSTKYRGRRVMPANIRNLFLPISMVRVQIESIVSENLLTLAGELNMLDLKASDSILVGAKLATWMAWMKAYSSSAHSQNNCEWDLRLVMAILRRLKMFATSCVVDDEVASGSTKIDHILLKSIEYEVKPRLSKSEVELFYKGIEELYSTKSVELEAFTTGSHLSLLHAIKDAISLADFKNDKTIEDTIAQLAVNLNNQLETRTGVLLLGPTGSGKSATWRLLQSAQSQSIKWLAVNPRSCGKRMLFGFVDPLTRKWVDGVFTARVREAINILQDESAAITQVWIVLDGPIDPDWIESLNSVLDDNQVLTLSSGERLDFSLSSNQSIKLIFETTNVKFASPATISRLGLVYHNHDQQQNDRFLLKHVDKSIVDDQFKLVTGSPHAAINNTLTLMQSETTNFKPNPLGLWDREFALASKFLVNKTARLLIVCGDSTQVKRASFIRNLVSATSNQSVVYNCSRYSTSSHLLDLISAYKNRTYFILNNVQLIQCEDHWEVRSFIELLRYILTYGGYYDESTLSFKQIEAKFILTLNSLEQIDERTVSLANVIRLDSDEDQSELQEEERGDVQMIDETMSQFLTNRFLQSPSPILTLSSTQYGSGRRAKILDQFSDWKTFCFSNSKLAQQSLDSLEKILEDEMNNSSSSRQRQKGSQLRLFVLSNLECRLLGDKLKTKLFHCLNWLRQMWPKAVKFVYLSHNIHQDLQESTFWCSMGEVYHLGLELALDISMEVELRNKFKLDFDSKQIDKQQVDWLVDKITAFVSGQSVDLSVDLRRFNSYLGLIIDLINKSRSDLYIQKRTLGNGLSRLGEFEQNVENVKLKCNKEEQQLVNKKQEIEHLMRTIDEALQDAQHQREQMNELKSKQKIKTNEIQAKSQRVELELSKVVKLVESSKSEIAQYLKPEALNEIKTLRSPPKTIKDILDVLFVLLGITDSSWNSIKSYLTKYSLKDELTGYDFQKNLNQALLAKVESQIASRRESFNPQQAARASKAVVPILGWIQATLEYGRVLVRLKPLNEEMEGLTVESGEMSEAAEKIEDQLLEIDRKIDKDSSRLTHLKGEYEESQRKSSAIKLQLDRAQKVRSELDGQINKWRLRLTSIDYMLSGDQLVKICLMSASVALFHNTSDHSDNNNTIKEWLTHFELGDMTAEDFIARALNLISMDNETTSEYVFKAEETNRILQLITIRLCLGIQSSIVPFIDVCSHNNNRTITEDEMIQYLGFKAILWQTKNNVVIVRCDELASEWAQSIELGLRLNKLIVIDMHELSLDLDIIDLVLRKESSTNTSGRIILAGELNKHENIRHLVRPIKLLASYNSDEEIELTIMNFLINFYDPKLSHSASQLEQELQSKQIETKLMELNLLNRLATIGDAAAESDGLREDLVGVLSELHQLSGSLSADVRKLKAKMSELNLRQSIYSEFAKKAANFYKEFLADLGQIDKFYHMPLDRYMQLLVRQQEGNKQEGNTSLLNSNDGGDENRTTIDYEFISKQVMRPMRPDCRLTFQKKLQDQQVVLFGTKPDSTKVLESQLKLSILDLISYTAFIDVSRHQKGRLMVVLHDSTKSSPQVEVDEFFRQQTAKQTGAICCYYSKIYATADSTERLESALAKLATLDWSQDDETTTRCLCIANAHLSSKWINTRLVRLMESAPSEARIVVILIGETSSNIDGFDSCVLDYAHVKYWHDELSLNLINRFNLYTRSVVTSQVTTGSNLEYTSGSSSDAEMCTLSRELILFHVVCQELAKSSSGGQAIGWRQVYNFDYDQLCLAFKTMRKLDKNFNTKLARKGSHMDQFRQLFCHYIENIIYGARLETLEDELTLKQLIQRFLNSPVSGRQQLETLEQLESTLRTDNVIEYNRLLTDLIGLTKEQ